MLTFEPTRNGTGIRREALTALHYIAINGPLERGEFKAMTGLADRTAERALKALLDYGLLRSDTPKGRVYFGIPLASLRFLFPTYGRKRKWLLSGKVARGGCICIQGNWCLPN